jgi:hypothetical protein
MILLGEVKSAMGTPNGSLRSWMQEHRAQLMATRNRWSQAVSTGWMQWGQPRWETAGRGLRALARASGGFLTAPLGAGLKPSYVHADRGPNGTPGSSALLQGDPRRAAASLRSISVAPSPQHISTHPIAFMRPKKFSSFAHHVVRAMPVFDAELREQARKDAQPALASAMENKAYADANSALEQKLAAQLEDLFARKSEEFSSRLEGRLQSFYEQTASRLDLLSEGVVRHFCEVLNRQVTEALSTVTSEWVERNRALVNAEYHAALDRFAARLESISSSRLEGHRKEINNLSSTLKIRLRSVAHALEELGPAPHRT